MSKKVESAFKQTKPIPVYASSKVVQKAIKSSDINSSKILGIFDGECMDAAITNLNGLDITDEVMTVVFESDEYAKGIECGWFRRVA
jgi:hypothetical protein